MSEVPVKYWWQQLKRQPNRLVAGGFAAAILLGGILLALPASASGERIPLLDALFTATSAVCVTGLTVRDTGNDFSTFGHVVILTLIQLGGLGITTLSTTLFLLFGQPDQHAAHNAALLIHHPRAISMLELGDGNLIVAARPPSSIVGKPAGATPWLDRFGVALLAVWRAGQQDPPSPPDPEQTIAETDVLILAGHIDRLRELRRMR